ncbi:MAG: TIGR03862 family flavoprotein [Methylomonas sp.]|nr:TIGR03862 family flavoprotein [Methylomonas sp.]
MTVLKKTAAVIGAGPAGLMAAEVLTEAGIAVAVYDAMPSAGRKFLMAGKGGMNITHAEPLELFLSRYGDRRPQLQAMLRDFPPEALRAWVKGLGLDTFVGSSGRVFPTEMKAAPLLRAWLHRLRAAGVHFHMRHRWLGWDDQRLRFETMNGERIVEADALVLALGGGSWPQLGSNGAWQALLAAQGIETAALKPANCGFDVAWSDYFRSRFAGQPIKSVSITFTDHRGGVFRRQGELMISEYGLEGGLIYALAAAIRDEIDEAGSATILLDLLPNLSFERVVERLAMPRGKASMNNHLRRSLRLEGAKAAILREVLSKAEIDDSHQLVAGIKALPVKLTAPRPIEEAISSAGGIRFAAMDSHLMLHKCPGVFCAGEMLDWEAPTGGYLLTACMASGRAAGDAAAAWLLRQP